MSADADALRAAVERLEETTRELATSELSAARARELAEVAMELSGEVAALLARVLRDPDS